MATLALSGNLDSAGVRELLTEKDLSAITRRAGGMLFGSSRPTVPLAPPGNRSTDTDSSAS